ncbi:MAG: hypothetical protein WA919_02355 [Coleofasciculaceae cyanobacterium]
MKRFFRKCKAQLPTLIRLSHLVMGRLSQAKSVKLAVYTNNSFKSLPDEQRDKLDLVEIATRAKFPFPEAFAGDGFELGDERSHSLDENKVLSSPDKDGVIKEIISP